MSSPDDLARSLQTREGADTHRLADFLQAVIGTAAEGICVFTPISHFPFIRILIWNDRMTELTGFTVAEINERGWYQAAFPDPIKQQEAITGMALLISGQDLGQVEWSITRKDGTERLVAISTSRVQSDDGPTLVILMTDITDRRMAEAALRRSEERLAAAQRVARLGSWEWDVRTGSVWWSDELYRRYGKDPAVFHPSLESYLDLVHAEDRNNVQSVLTGVLAGGTSVKSEHRFIYPNGSVGWSQMHALVERDANEIAMRMSGTCQDVTEQKRATEARHALEEQLREARRLESIGVLAGGMAHEFNNLLTLILGHTEMAVAELPATSSAKAHLEPIRTAGLRAAEMCRQMLAYAGRSRLVLELVELSSLIAEVMRGLDLNVAIDLDLTADLPCVRGDAEQLRQLVGNLLLNAAEALAGAAGRVTLATYRDRLDVQSVGRLVHTPGLRPGEYVTLQVRDGGLGMEDETLDRAFEPFFSTKFPGRGLGLPVVLGILRVHGGGIEVDTAPGRGTTIRVYLPIADA